MPAIPTNPASATVPSTNDLPLRQGAGGRERKLAENTTHLPQTNQPRAPSHIHALEWHTRTRIVTGTPGRKSMQQPPHQNTPVNAL
jgi:hypothetical protein